MNNRGDEDDNGLEFECQLCGQPFPADPSGVVESLDAEEIEGLEEWELGKLEDLEQFSTGEVYFVCPKCLENMDKYDGGPAL